MAKAYLSEERGVRVAAHKVNLSLEVMFLLAADVVLRFPELLA
ncbi:MAG: hypothetical protein ACYDEV_10030 [Acidiferrobacter sp.]